MGFTQIFRERYKEHSGLGSQHGGGGEAARGRSSVKDRGIKKVTTRKNDKHLWMVCGCQEFLMWHFISFSWQYHEVRVYAPFKDEDGQKD